MKNTAIAYIKPHAIKSLPILETLKAILEDAGAQAGEFIPIANAQATAAFDLQNGKVAEYALMKDFSGIKFSVKEKKLFEKTFSCTLEEALEKGSMNPWEAVKVLKNGGCHKHGHCDCHGHGHEHEHGHSHCDCHEHGHEMPAEDALLQLWAQAGAICLREGLYISYLQTLDRFVVNGFYPAERKAYDDVESPGVYLFRIDFDQSWMDFNDVVIGDENPAGALEESVRGFFYDRRDALGIRMDLFDNMLYAGRSPFEALRDALIWFPDEKPAGDPVWQELMKKKRDTKKLRKAIIAAGDTPEKREAFAMLDAAATAEALLA